MSELVAVVGILLLVAAVIRAGTTSVTWMLLRLRLSRLLTAGLVLLLLVAAVAHLAGAGPESPTTR